MCLETEAITVVDYRDKCLRGSLTRGPRCKWYETGHEYASLILNTESDSASGKPMRPHGGGLTETVWKVKLRGVYKTLVSSLYSYR